MNISTNYATRDAIMLKQNIPFLPCLSAKLGINSSDIKNPRDNEIPKYHWVFQQNVGIAMMAILGLSWPGKLIVGLAYGSEFFCRNQKKSLIFSFFLTNAVILCFIPNFYEYINRDWYPLQAIGLIFGTASLCYCILFMPESLWTYY
jgi:hypothetical protein